MVMKMIIIMITDNNNKNCIKLIFIITIINNIVKITLVKYRPHKLL